MIVCGWVCYSMTLCVCVVCSAWQHGGYVYGMCGAWFGGGGCSAWCECVCHVCIHEYVCACM